MYFEIGIVLFWAYLRNIRNVKYLLVIVNVDTWSVYVYDENKKRCWRRTKMFSSYEV